MGLPGERAVEGMDDLRRDERYSSRHPVVVKLQQPSDEGGEQTCICELKDLSRRGLKLVLRRPLSVGSKLPISVRFDTLKQVADITGIVKWCLEIDEFPTYLAGIEILEMSGMNGEDWQKVIVP